MTTTILAAFEHRQPAARALERLADAGIPRERMQVEHELEALRHWQDKPPGRRRKQPEARHSRRRMLPVRRLIRPGR